MALGGGTWQTQNKPLPGSYINFVSASRATAALSDRGVAAMPLVWGWGPEGEVFEVTAEAFQKDSLSRFGYDYTHEKMKGLRDLFSNIRKAYFYRLGTGVKAANDFATAKYTGTRGNDIQIAIAKNAADADKFDVSTLLDGRVRDQQTVAAAGELKNNDLVTWKTSATLAATAGTPLAEGADAAALTGDDYQAFLDKVEPYSFNTLGCAATDEAVKALFVQFTKRLRDEQGVKFQTVLYRPGAVDHEGVIGVQNEVTDEGWPESSLVYWVTGAEAGCAVNRSVQNAKYNGEFTVDAALSQEQLADALAKGQFVMHRVGDETRVLDDINTFVSFTEGKGEDFAANQTVRVLDQIGNDVAVLFSDKYLGAIPNDNAGRVSFWSDVVSLLEKLQAMRAIENFVSDDVTVAQGESKKAVVCGASVTPVNAMSKLYMTVTVN